MCFIPLQPSTLEKNRKRKSNLQINVNSIAMASLYELLSYHSLEHLDPIMDDFLTFIHSALFSQYSSPAISTVLPKAADGDINCP